MPAWARRAMLVGLSAHPKHLAKVPDAVAALENSPDDAVRTRAPALKAAWAKASSLRQNRALSGEGLEHGKAMYAICGACHGPEGKGQPGIAPPLEGSTIVAGSVDDLLKAILQGRNLDRQNKAFPDMPALAGLPDADIAAVATYVRAQWGPPSRAIPIGRVRQIRQEVGAPAAPAATESPAAPQPAKR